MSIQDSEIHAWTDSKIVLLWLSSHPKCWETTISNRTSKILESLPSNSWHYVPSKENPADIATRSINPQNLGSCRLRWHDPNFLHQDFNYWPLEDPASEQIHEELLQQRKITEIKSILFRWVQERHFPDELNSLQAGKTLSPSSKILSLNPFLDNGILWIGGWIKRSNLPFKSKHPLLSPDNDIESLHALTPSHFLIGEKLSFLPDEPANEEPLHGTRWQLVQSILKGFWKRYHNEYLHSLQQRTKWREPEENLRVGDLVIIKESNLPPATWPFYYYQLPFSFLKLIFLLLLNENKENFIN
ncbi:uncharacterized protein CDAR_621421 [Caerostris darwini]|uniref:DUF5641 domain-containing protein n=1 Tax=Caerostris darwini TaxID=1538125 RepID=A0AAV4S772_9ARAC|nr:uncharacterized protein CDAR_621421 [Caerostris darwini]